MARFLIGTIHSLNPSYGFLTVDEDSAEDPRINPTERVFFHFENRRELEVSQNGRSIYFSSKRQPVRHGDLKKGGKVVFVAAEKQDGKNTAAQWNTGEAYLEADRILAIMKPARNRPFKDYFERNQIAAA